MKVSSNMHIGHLVCARGQFRRRAAWLLPIVCQDNDYARGGASLEQRVVYRTCSRGECGCVGVVVSPPEQMHILMHARA